MENEGDSDTNCNWCVPNNLHRLGKGTGRLKNQRASGDHPDYSISKNAQNTEKSPGGLRKFAVTQTLVKNHQLTLM